jgi:hypothetical protein
MGHSYFPLVFNVSLASDLVSMRIKMIRIPRAFAPGCTIGVSHSLESPSRGSPECEASAAIPFPRR